MFAPDREHIYLSSTLRDCTREVYAYRACIAGILLVLACYAGKQGEHDMLYSSLRLLLR